MRKSMVFFIALAVLAAGGAAWADTNTLTVSASVKGTCKFSSPTSTLAFGQMDPSSSAPVNATNTTNFWCTKNLLTTIALGADMGSNPPSADGKRQMKDSVSSDLIPYSLDLVASGGANLGPNFPRTITISGSVLNKDYIEKSEGDYLDTVKITFTP